MYICPKVAQIFVRRKLQIFTMGGTVAIHFGIYRKKSNTYQLHFDYTKLSSYQVQVKVTCIRSIVSNSNGAKYNTNNKQLDFLHLLINILFKHIFFSLNCLRLSKTKLDNWIYAYTRKCHQIILIFWSYQPSVYRTDSWSIYFSCTSETLVHLFLGESIYWHKPSTAGPYVLEKAYIGTNHLRQMTQITSPYVLHVHCCMVFCPLFAYFFA